jgi:putative DNA primase/helicase
MSAGRSQSAEGAAMINDYSTEDALDLRALADEPTDDDIEIGRLARLSPIEYERDRKIAAEQMGVRTTILDRLVAVERDNIDGDGAKQGRGLTLPEPQPWPDPVEGIELLGELSAAIKRHVVMPDHVADAVAMWAVHTYIVECFGISPRLAITSPEKGCGKTTLLDVVSRLVWRPLSTAAAIFRVVDILQPTLLIDEADTFLRDNEDLRGVLNSGHRHGGSVLRTVGDDHEPRPFATYSACAIALIGKLPATLADRSITAELRRRLASEAVEPFRHDRTTHLDMLARKAARWASDNADCVRGADPDIPAGIFNRVADNWRPLLAIADAAGGDWPERARRVLAAMAGANDDQSTGAMLFADIRDIFSEREADRLPSSELAEALVAIEGRPWAEWRHGKPITANGLARLLAPYGIAPATIRVGTKTPKGYQLADFADAFERYLPPDGASKAQHRNKADEMGTSTTSATATAAPWLRFENAKKPNNDGQCCDVAVANPGEAHRAHVETRCNQCGQPATSADPLHPWDWPGRPDGILLHRRCEQAWIDRPPVFERNFSPTNRGTVPQLE